MSTWTIGKAARRAGVGIETIRFYERQGLIDQPPKPPAGGYRVYSEEAINRVRFVRQAQELGFTLKECFICERAIPFEYLGVPHK